MRALDIPCIGYSVKADVYDGKTSGPVVLSLIGRTSYRRKKRYPELARVLKEQLGVTTVIFDYTGHGDSPFSIDDLTPAQHMLEVAAVFDWIKKEYPDRPIVVIGSSYGGYLAATLIQYRQFEGLILRAPAIYEQSNFYTPKKNEDTRATDILRRNPEALSRHSLLTRAFEFRGKAFLIVHGNDERIPKETTDAYAKAFDCPVYVADGFPHSLDRVGDTGISNYNNVIIDWIRREIVEA